MNVALHENKFQFIKLIIILQKQGCQSAALSNSFTEETYKDHRCLNMHTFFMQCAAAQIASPRIVLAFYFLKV